MKGYTSEQNMMTVEDGYNTADDGGLLQIRESSGFEEQHRRSFHETSWRIAYTSTREEIGITLSGYDFFREKKYGDEKSEEEVRQDKWDHDQKGEKKNELKQKEDTQKRRWRKE